MSIIIYAAVALAALIGGAFCYAMCIAASRADEIASQFTRGDRDE